jgi:hypothetical protein
MSASRCAWCDTSFENQLVYNLSAVLGGSRRLYVIGECCVGMPCTDFANRHGCPPMRFDFAPTVANVRRLYAYVPLCETPRNVKAALAAADETCAHLSKADQVLARQPQRRSSRVVRAPSRYC